MIAQDFFSSSSHLARMADNAGTSESFHGLGPERFE